MVPAGWVCIWDLRLAALTMVATTPPMKTMTKITIIGVKYPKPEKPFEAHIEERKIMRKITPKIAEQIGFPELWP